MTNFNFEIFNKIYIYLFLPELYIFITFIIFFFFLFLYSLVKYLKFIIVINYSILFYSQIIFHTFFLFINNISYNYLLFYSSYYSNFFSILLKLIFLCLFLCFLIFSYDYLYFKKIYISEFSFLLGVSLLASLLACSANDFIFLYLVLELQNICIYILISLKRSSNIAIEASLKYFLLSSITMGFFLYGISLCYFSSGITNFFDLELFLWNFSFDPLMLLGFFFVLISILVKVGLPPFYTWIIDVYSGCSIFLLFYFLIFLKFFYFMILFRFFIIFYELFFFFSDIILYLILLSIIISVISAIYQIKFKQLFIFSSILNSSFFLFTFLLDLNDCYVYFIYFLIVYMLNMLGVYIVLSFFISWSKNIELRKISNLIGLFYINPYLTFFFVVFLLSLSGLPPFFGFFYKLYFFYFLINNNLFGLFLIVFIFYSLGIFYYLRLIKLMFINKYKNWIFLKPLNKFKLYFLVTLFWINNFFFFFQNFILNFIFEWVYY